MPHHTPFTLAADEVCIDHETDITAGELDVNDAYDLYLIARGKPVREYKLVCFMNLQFFFQDKNGKWTDLQKQRFVNDWVAGVKSAWNRKLLRMLSNGVQVVLEFEFKTQVEGIWVFDHWEISVQKTNSFEQSYVTPSRGSSQLDSMDLVLTQKPNGRQRGVVHEFGHMIGLEDEYKPRTRWQHDSASVMNNGEIVRNRHIAHFVSWVNHKLRKHNIK